MRYFSVVAFLLVFTACSRGPKVPDVSGIEAPLKVVRFDRELFSADTSALIPALDRLVKEHPNFATVFLGRVINVDPSWSKDTAALYVKGFLSAYRPVYDSAQDVFKSFDKSANEIRQGLKFVKYYFPKYALPTTVYTFIGPLDGYGGFLVPGGIAVGLQHHLGAGYSMYQNEYVANTYAAYVSRNFVPETVPIDAMKNIVADMFPDASADKTLMVQMVESGKRLYLLQALLPYAPQHLLIGYTKSQLDDCYAHERLVWDLFIRNNYLQSTDNNLIRNYVGPNPKTQELGEAAPGDIGSFCGWQIVKKYMEKYPETKLPALMAMDAEELFAAAKYKP